MNNHETTKNKQRKSWDMSDVPSWDEIEKKREQREKEGKTISVYWVNDKQLKVSVGDESELVTPEEAMEKYSDPDIISELKSLLYSDREEYKKEIKRRDSFEESNEAIGIGLDIAEVRRENQRKLDEIAEELNLHESEEPMRQLGQCVSIQKYIATHNTYDGGIMEAKSNYPSDEIVDRDLYNAAINNVGVCTSNSIEMRALFDRIGVKSECVGLKSRETNGMHMAVIAELVGEYYYFDPTLERTIFIANRGEDAKPEELIVCCAGMGSSEYTTYYEPQCIVNRDNHGVSPLPENMAIESIPKQIINGVV